MRIYLAGGTGVIGRQLIPLLVSSGNTVIATTRQSDRLPLLQGFGAQPALVDVLDRHALIRSVEAAQPDAIIHQLTDLSAGIGSSNAKLRIEGTRNLVDAARAAGVERMVAQSISFVLAPGDSLASEDAPLDDDPTEPRKTTIDGVRALETAVAELDRGVVLRYGNLYGPGTWYDRTGQFGIAAQEGKLPATPAWTSFIHVRDAARAALAALEWESGIVNIVDDEPARGHDWVPVFCDALGAPAPPVEDAPRSGRPVSNRSAISLGFIPDFPTWRQGFATL